MNTTASPLTFPTSSSAMRRALAWLKRLGLGLLAFLAGLAALGFTYQAAATALDRRAYPAPGQLVDVGGRQMHLYCAGANLDGRKLNVNEARPKTDSRGFGAGAGRPSGGGGGGFSRGGGGGPNRRREPRW